MNRRSKDAIENNMNHPASAPEHLSEEVPGQHREDVEELKGLYLSAAQSAGELARQVTRLAQQRPFTAMVVTAAAGFLLGWTAAQRR
jgi:ElaB/YqjD/DUF883 family membrane-anchored ribosome-binding protein